MTDGSGLSASDVLAMTKDNNYDGYGSMWNNPFVYLIWIYAFRMFGNGFGYDNGAAIQGALTRADLFEGFNNQEVMNGIRGIQNGLCDGFYAMNTSNLQGQFDLSSKLAENRFAQQNCCCETNRNIDAVRYENAKNTCDIITSGNMNTRDIIDSQNAGFQKILDTMCQDKIDALRTELQSAQLQLGNLSQTNTIINAVRPFPQPAYITCSPYAAANTGCGVGCA